MLIYDGVHWRTVRVANGSAVRSLDVGPDDKVYVGARGEFGYLAADESGLPRYVSLLDKVPAECRRFKDVWRTISTPDGVIFQSFEILFRYKPDQPIKVWRPAKRFLRAFAAGGGLYVQGLSRALLMRLQEDSLHVTPGGEAFSSKLIYCVAAPQDKKLLVGEPAGFFEQEGAAFVRRPTEADAFLSKAHPYSLAASFLAAVWW